MTIPVDPELLAAITAARAAGIAVPDDLFTEQEPVPGATRRSIYVTVRDGVKLAVDVILPAINGETRLPTCIRSTRYWRSGIDSPGREHVQELEAQRWLRAGFALVLVDARGTGASFGTWDRCWDDAQRDELSDIVDWVIAQPWSDGTVGGYGTSYDGATAHLLAATGHPAVKAVVPRFAGYDGFRHVTAPGGVSLLGFLEAWAAGNWQLDGHPERATRPPVVPLAGRIRPVDDDLDGSLLAAAVAEHAGNWDLWGDASRGICRDDTGPLPDAGNGSPVARIAELRSSGTPMWLWSAWYDAAYADAQLVQLADPELDVRVTIGPYSHGGGMPSLGDPLQPELRNPPFAGQIADIAAYLTLHQTGVGPDPSPARLRYYRLGDGWREASTWPPEQVAFQRKYLAGTGGLADSADAGRRTYAVDFEANSGLTLTRWDTLIGGPPVEYPDRAAADERLLVWDGPVLEKPTGITGHAVAHLDVIADATDFAAFVYLEAVLPDGKVLYVTEGQLRALHRKPGEGDPPYEMFGPWHSFTAADMLPVVPGEVTTLAFALLPISILLPAGSRIRVALAGADSPRFRRVPETGPVTLEVLGSSWIDLPLEA